MFKDFLFNTFWIVTGLGLNLLALTMLFILFVFVWSMIKATIKGDGNEQ